MESTQKKNIVAAVYYNRSSWHELIKFISPILKDAHRNRVLDTYHVDFGFYGGEHIKFTLNHSDNEDGFQRETESLIKQFLLSNPSETKVIEYPLNTFFMNYPNNSIWFNQSDRFVLNGLEDIKWKISLAFLEALGTEEIDLDSSYTFLCYMQMGILKAAYPDIKLAHSNAVDLICYLNNLKDIEEIEIGIEGKKGNPYLTELFNENQDVLSEIVKDVWEHADTDVELKWISAWELACKNFLIGSDFKSSFVLLSKLVYEQLGFTYNINLLQISLKLMSASFRTC